MNTTIIIIMIIGMIIHKYLSTLNDLGKLPHNFGFLIFATFFIVTWLINFIWMFGFLIGIIIFILSLFSIIHMTFLWPFQLPWLLKLQKDVSVLNVNKSVYALWSFIVMLLIALTIINFFISDYKLLYDAIMNLLIRNYVILIAFSVISNIIRYIVQVKLVDDE